MESNAEEKTSTSQRGKKPVLSREYVCDQIKNNEIICKSSFRTNNELKKHIRTCHCHVICGYCKRLLSFESYKTSHLKRYIECRRKVPIACNSFGKFPADWTIPEEFWIKFKRVSESLSMSETRSEGASASELEAVEDPPVPDRTMEGDPTSLVETIRSPEMGGPSVINEDAQSADRDVEEEFASGDNTTQDSGIYSISSSGFSDSQDTPTRSASWNTKRRLEEEQQSTSSTPPEKRRSVADQRITKYSGNRRRMFKGTPTPIAQEVVGVDLSTETENTTVAIMGSRGEPEAAATESEEAMYVFWLDMIRQVTLGESSLDMTLQLQEILNREEGECSIFQIVNQAAVRANERVLKIWHMLNNMFSVENATLEVPFGVIDGYVLDQTLKFMHSGAVFLEADKLMKYLRADVIGAINAFVIGLMTLSSVQTMTKEEFFNLCDAVVLSLHPLLQKLMQLCCLWRVLRHVADFRDSRNITCKWSEALQMLVAASMENENFRQSQILSIQEQLVQHLTDMECASRVAGLPRGLQFECTEGQVSSIEQNVFLAKLIRIQFEKGQLNVLLHVIKHNYDPFNRAYDASFEFNVMYGSKLVGRRFYIHSLVLLARLGIDASVSQQQFREIRATLTGKTFQNYVVLRFWQLLHDYQRNDGWNGFYELKQLVDLSGVFRIKSIPLFLCGYDEPTTPAKMKRLIEIYNFADDTAGLSQMCRRMLYDINLTAELDVPTMIEVLKRDDLAIEELDIYELVVRYSSRGVFVDVTTDTVPFEVGAKFTSLRQVVRFGIIPLADFDEKVFQDPYLSPEVASAFRNNIYWTMKAKPGRFIVVPDDDFIKPYQPRCANAIARI